FGNGDASNEASPVYTYNATGVYTVTLTVTDEDGITASTTLEITVVPDVVFSLFLNTGSNATVNFDGKVFVGDRAFPSYYNSTHTYSNISASDLPLYQSEKGSMGDLMPLNYSIPVPNGTYRISTYHHELYYGKASGAPSGIANRRVIDILIEGELVKDNLDLFIESGNNPVKLTFNDVVVTDGILNIDMPASVSRPSISGIAIEKYSDGNINDIPQAVITYTPACNITTETAVQFSSEGSTDDEGIVNYAWDFGDGATSTEENPEHTFT